MCADASVLFILFRRLYLKNRIALWPKTNLNIKVELHARSSFENSKPKDVNKSVEGRIELSQKILNLTGATAAADITAQKPC